MSDETPDPTGGDWRPADPDAQAPPEPPKPTRDTPPKRRGKRKRTVGAGTAQADLKGAAKAAASKKLEAKLAEVLVFPAVPAVMFSPDPITGQYMVEHFTRSGPVTAAALVEAAEDRPELRALLERIVAGGSLFGLAMALAAYIGPPIMWTIGMRQLAQQFTVASTMGADEMARMMAAHAAAAQAAANGSPEQGQPAPAAEPAED